MPCERAVGGGFSTGDKVLLTQNQSSHRSSEVEKYLGLGDSASEEFEEWLDLPTPIPTPTPIPITARRIAMLIQNARFDISQIYVFDFGTALARLPCSSLSGTYTKPVSGFMASGLETECAVSGPDPTICYTA